MIRRANMVLPDPGGPCISRWWPPAAATSSARLAIGWPLISARSGAASRTSGHLVVPVRRSPDLP